MHVFIFHILAGYSYIRSHSNLYIKKKCEEDDKPEIWPTKIQTSALESKSEGENVISYSSQLCKTFVAKPTVSPNHDLS